MKSLDEYDAVVAKVDAAVAHSSRLAADQISCRAGCDSCCVAGLTVFPVEAASLQRFLDAHVPAFSQKGEGWCTFVAVDGRCAVYDARPLLCRTHGLPLKGLQPEKRGSLRVVAEGVSVCGLNFTGRSPTAAETLDAEAVLKLLIVVDRRFRGAAGLPDDLSRVSLEQLKSTAP